MVSIDPPSSSNSKENTSEPEEVKHVVDKQDKLKVEKCPTACNVNQKKQGLDQKNPTDLGKSKESEKKEPKKEPKKPNIKPGDKKEDGKTPKKGQPKSEDGAIAKYSIELREIIKNSILDKANIVKWEDLIGLEELKKKMQQCIILPIKNPKFFTGLRAPSKGILMFGPPGNGKTMVAKAVASQFNGEVTFFNLSAGEFTSRYYGDSEKLVRALFEIAAEKQPSVIFIDEIDSILGRRKEGELDVSRRIKTEFLVRLDGVGTKTQDRILIIGATNRPFDLDDAVMRRFTSRIFLPLPNFEARKQMLVKQLESESNSLTEKDVAWIAKNTEGYSFADLMSLCAEAARGAINNFGISTLIVMEKDRSPPITMQHFELALKKVVKSVSEKSIKEFECWNKDNKS